MFELIEEMNMDALLKYLAIRAMIIFGCWGFVFAANIIDCISGRNTAKALGVKIDSKGYRKTFHKVKDYYIVLACLILFDCIGILLPFYSLPFATMLGSLSVIVIEFLSVIENSRKKKSRAADIPDMAKEIVQCNSVEKAIKLYDKIKNIANEGTD